MKTLSLAQLEVFLPFLKDKLVNKHLLEPTLLLDKVFSFKISGKEKEGLIISLLSNESNLYLSKEVLSYPSIYNKNFETFKRELPNPLIKDVSLLNNDRIVSIECEILNRVYKEETRFLIIELIPSNPNLLLLDEEGKIIFILRPTSLDNKRPLMKGLKYSLLEKSALTYKENSLNLDEYLLDTNKVISDLLDKRKREEFATFIKEYKRNIKRVERKIEAINEDILESKKHLEDDKKGDAIYINLEELKGKKVTKFTYLDEEITLDPSLSLNENALRYYKKAKKAKETIKCSEINLKNALKEKEENEIALGTILEGDLLELERIYKNKEKKKEKKEVISSAILPYRVLYKDTYIYFGKNAKQNDALTFLYLTAKNHLWFHINGEKGPHVIIKKDNPDGDTIFLAESLALIGAGKEEGEVISCLHKDLRKGSNLGEVKMKNYKVTRLNNVSKEANELFLKAEKMPLRKN